MKTCYLRAMKLLFAMPLMGAAHGALAASFDCAKASSSVEKMICGDAEVSALDNKLQQAYKTALAATDAYGKKTLATEQRNWIKYTRGICQDATCLQQVYTDRIAVLARNDKNILDDASFCATPAGSGNDAKNCGVAVQIYRDPNGRTESFSQVLTKAGQGGQIIGCRRLIDMWNGTHIGPGRGEETFGGVCVLQDGAQRKDVEICSDKMGGDFQMRPADSPIVADKQLIDFTYACGDGQ